MEQGAVKGMKRAGGRDTNHSPVDKLRTLVWFRRVQAIAGCTAAQMTRKILLEDKEIREYSLYEDVRRMPKKETVEAVEIAPLLGSTASMPFAGTAQLFMFGPDGTPLWAVLSGNLETRRNVVDDIYAEEFGRAKLRSSSLQDKFEYLKSQLYDIDQLGKVNEYIRTSQLVPYRHLMERHTLIGAAGIAPPAFRNLRRGARFDMGSVVAAVALAYAAYELKSDIATADFLMVDAFYVLRAKMPEIHDELTEYFLAETTRLSNGLFGIDQLADPLKYSKADDDTKELLAPLFIEKGKI